jgi:hypothetical protein
MKKLNGFGSFLYQLVQNARLAGFTIVLILLAVDIVFYVLQWFAHLIHVR